MSLCPSCQVVRIPGERFCRACGKRFGGLSVLWMVAGACLMFMLSALVISAFYQLQGPARDVSSLRSGHALYVLGGALGVGFLVGGLIVGRVSEGRTVIEAGIAAALALGLLVGAALARKVIDGSHGTLAIAIAAPVSIALALGGAWLGERWQGTGGAQ